MTVNGGSTTDDSSSSSSSSSFPFRHVVVTFPDARAAHAADIGPLQKLRSIYSSSSTTSINIIASSDPYGCRVGSGGGTLAALSDALLQASASGCASSSNGATTASNGSEDHNGTPHTTTEALLLDGSLLILHAGGASSRCPTQMVLGKAWTSLPCRRSGGLENPIFVCMKLCQQLFQGLTSGSIVVMCSDIILLNIPPSPHPTACYVPWEQHDASSSVLVLAVPTGLETARNHGVFVLGKNKNNNDNDKDPDDKTSSRVCSCRTVYQKPGWETLTQKCAFSSNDNQHNNQQQQQVAWTDTGIVVFLPQAAQALYHLATQTELAACTSTGLEKLYYNQEQQQRQQQSTSLEEFAAKTAPSVDLYTDFLQALSLESRSGPIENSLASYRERLPNLSETASATIHSALSPLELNIWTVPQGSMLHLGTTRELMDHYILGAAAGDGATIAADEAAITLEENGGTASDDNDKEDILCAQRRALCRESGRQLGFVQRLDCIAQAGTRQISPSTVIFNSLLQAKENNIVIGEASLLEHNVFSTNASIRIGNDCLVSGLRATAQDEHDGFALPDSIMVQKIALLQQTSTSNNGEEEEEQPSFVYMVLGIDDAIKKGNVLYNQTLDGFLQWSGLSRVDLWPDDDGSSKEDHQVLWNAKIHPVVTNESFMSLFSWLVPFAEKSSLERWKTATRLSLADIRSMSDALTEFHFRSVLIPREMEQHKTTHLEEISEILLGRRHESIDLQFAVDEYVSNGKLDDVYLALHALDRVITKAFADQMFDVCGRACMVASAFLSELEKATPRPSATTAATSLFDIKELERLVGRPIEPGKSQSEIIQSIWLSLLSELRQSEQICVIEKLVSLRDFLLKQAPSVSLPDLSSLMESLAHFMTQKCVIGFNDFEVLLQNKDSPVLDQWVLASAPARIDLAGGWSDTPPICFEYGGAVTGIAVKIDNMKPLVCRSRIIQGRGGGILLRTEHRGYNCELFSDIETEVRTFEDMCGYNNPSTDCALLKSALICLGFVSPRDVREKSGDIQPAIDAFCGVPNGTCARLEIVSSSMVPHGSGLGTSSILGGCVLAAIAKNVGINFGSDYCHDLIRGVLILEQHLTTGGGWQDQCNGLVGGAKIVTCNPYVFPLDLSIEQLQLDPGLEADLDGRLFLVFTGKTRLAKNILGNALGRWSKRTRSIVGNLSSLVEGARTARDALIEGDLDSLGSTLSSYWEQKKLMCGEESGVEPAIVSAILRKLKESELIRGGALCGAGGGGFLTLLLQDKVREADLVSVLNKAGEEDRNGLDANMSVHKCTICDSGLEVVVLSNVVQDSSAQFFDPLWLSAKD